MSQELFQEMGQSIIDGDADKSAHLAGQALAAGIEPLEAITRGYVNGVNHIGEQFACGNAFLPELVMAGEAMKSALAVLEPEMTRRGTQREVPGTVVLATVHGDIHEIGKSLVGTMLTAAGFKVHDLGVDAPSEAIIDKALEVGADIIALSAMLTTTMVKQRDLIGELESRGLRDRIKVMVGGSPVTREWVQSIRADGYSEDAIGAVEVAKKLAGERNS